MTHCGAFAGAGRPVSQIPPLPRRESLAALCALFAWLLAVPVLAQGPPPLLTFGVTGSESGNYTSVMSHPEVQRLLLDIAKEPREKEYIDSALAGSGISLSDLESLGLVQQHNNRYVIHFTLFTQEDLKKIRSVSEKAAESLAAELMAHRSEIEAALAQYPLRTVDRRSVAYILLGCFSLDWDGLDLTAAKDYRSQAVKQPNGDQYVPWAEERGELTLRAIYWGSHNSGDSEVLLTSFGDHFSVPREAFPDLSGRMGARLRHLEVSPELAPKLSAAGQTALAGMQHKVGLMMLALRDGEKTQAELASAAAANPKEAETIVALLTELEYVRQEGGRYHAVIPVLSERDRNMAQDVRRIGWKVMDRWLASHYESVKADLNDITPLRSGVTYADSFTQIWHYIFGMTNQKLVEAGLFEDPYGSLRKRKGFIPCVWSPALESFDHSRLTSPGRATGPQSAQP